MIDHFLKETLPRHYNANPDDIEIPMVVQNHPFTCVDNKACREAESTGEDKKGVFNKYKNICLNCDKVVLTVDNNGQSVRVVNFEEYIKQLPAKATSNKGRCDLLMSDGIPHNKIVFCDLCCYDEKYIEPHDNIRMSEGKRAKARKQMEDSIEFFMQVDNSLISQYILTFPKKVCLFAYKSYDSVQQPTRPQRGNVETSMQAMLTTPSSMSGQVITENKIMDYKFTFVQNKYPNVYTW